MMRKNSLPDSHDKSLKKAAKSVGEKSVELLHVKDITKVTGYVRGGCSPLGMKKKLPTYLDESALRFDTIAVSAGKRGMQMILPPNDLIRASDAKVGTIARERAKEEEKTW